MESKNPSSSEFEIVSASWAMSILTAFRLNTAAAAPNAASPEDGAEALTRLEMV